MKLVRWEFMGLHMPMMEDEAGELFCTSKALLEALGINKDVVDHIVSRHGKELGTLRAENCQSKEFLQKHKVELGILRVRQDMRLWSEDDMLTFAFHAHSDKSLEFRKQLRQFIKANAKRGYVSEEQFNLMRGELRTELDAVRSELRAIVDKVSKYGPAADAAASMAGKALRAQRDTKPLRLVANSY